VPGGRVFTGVFAAARQGHFYGTAPPICRTSLHS